MFLIPIEDFKDIDALFLDELLSSLYLHKQKMNRSSTTNEQAPKASTLTEFSNFRGRGRGRGRYRGMRSRGNIDVSR